MEILLTTPARIFFWVGLFVLAMQTYSDLKSGEIDSRRSWFMYGVILALVLVSGMWFWAYFLFMLAAGVLVSFTKKALADGDRETLVWASVGFFVINPFFLFTFLLSFVSLLAVHVFLRRLIKKQGVSAGLPVLFGAFVINFFLFYAIW